MAVGQSPSSSGMVPSRAPLQPPSLTTKASVKYLSPVSARARASARAEPQVST